MGRAAAIAAGDRFYTTGRPCKAGHVAQRYTSSGECVVCESARRERNAAARQKQAADWYAANRESKIQQAADWYASNPELAKATRRRWREENPSRLAAIDAKRRAVKMRALPEWDSELTRFVSEEAAELARLRTRIFGFQWDVDHMVPLQAKNACGLHVWSNLQVIPARLNAEKFNHMRLTTPGEWIAHL